MYLFFILLFTFFSAPFLFIIATAIYCFNGRPVFFKQKRVGQNGKLFAMYKFRTMVPNAEKLRIKLLKKNEANGLVFKIHNDPRFTGIGKFLSHTGLDELPQLFNVLKGNMALIGPRPLPVYEANKLKKWQQQRHQIKPGILSPWILNGYHSQKFDDWMKSDIQYAKRKSVAIDAILLYKGFILLLTLLWRETLNALR